VRFFVDASLPRSAALRLRQLNQDAVDVRDIGMRSATDDVIAVHVRVNRLALITRDVDFAELFAATSRSSRSARFTEVLSGNTRAMSESSRAKFVPALACF